MFRRVITDIGGYYNRHDGSFQCPKAGLYLFSVTLEGYNTRTVKGHLMKNSVAQAVIYSTMGSANHYQSASATLVLWLKAGDTVWVKGERGMQYHHPSYFTGLYVRP